MLNRKVIPFVASLSAALLAAGCNQKTDAPVPVANAAPIAATTAPPIPVKVVVVSMFEIGDDTGDVAAEFQLWRERQKLEQRIPFAHHHDLYYNADTGVLGMVTGMGTANSATAVMALGLDPRFDLSKAYWLVAGIAGFDPEDASIGSAAWANWLVDGDLAHEIDPREMPQDWPTGYFAMNTKKPYDSNKPKPTNGEVFELNAGLVEWAYQLTKDVPLPDSDVLKKRRDLYEGFPNAQKPPFVMKGDNLASMTYWHGKVLNEWANGWVDYWTDAKGEFVSSAMEDTGTAVSLHYLEPTGKADKDRLLVLRTASNYTMQPPGLTAAENMLMDHDGYAGLEASIEAAYRVGSKVVDEIVTNWATYENRIPSAVP